MSTSNNILPPGVPSTHSLGPLPSLIDGLRTFTKDTATNSQSDDLGTSTVSAGPTSETLVPLFLRCTWPAGRKSRHKLIWIRPSVSDDAFGTTINDTFNVLQAGGAVHHLAAVWRQVNPFTDATAFGVTARDEVKRAVGLSDPPTRQQIIRMMGGTMNGIMQVMVEPLQDAVKCHLCGRRRPIDQDKLDTLRKSAFGVTVFCIVCAREHGMLELQRIHEQAEEERRQIVRL